MIGAIRVRATIGVRAARGDDRTPYCAVSAELHAVVRGMGGYCAVGWMGSPARSAVPRGRRGQPSRIARRKLTTAPPAGFNHLVTTRLLDPLCWRRLHIDLMRVTTVIC